jgi:Ca2+-binding RTX toxin-like protein
MRSTSRTRRLLVGLVAMALGVVGVTATVPAAQAAVAPVGNGFTVTPADLAFILKQIKIAERHSRALQGTEPGIPANPNPTADPDYCQALLAPGVDRVPDILTSYGLRTVDGSCNNLKTGVANDKVAAADQPFPRLTTPVFRNAEGVAAGFFGPGSPSIPSSSYSQKLAGNLVFDSQPRVVSNLIVDQTSTNPAAVAAAAFPVRTQGNPGLHPCTTDPDPLAVPPVEGVPAGCVPSHQTLFIPNVTTDVGLSPPYNSLFTFFGQFFDHGVDQTVKSGATVFVPLRADDPLITLGPDGKPNTGDEVPDGQRFMVLTRAQNQPGPDGVLGTADDIQDANNTDTPWVDQSQTYSSHPSHQVFLREYVLNAANHPVSTGKLLGGLPAGQTYLNSPDGQTGIGTWAAVKKQAAALLGLKLVDADVTNIPMLAVDPYGQFIPGPNGLPQYVTATGLVEGNLAAPVGVPANVLHFDTPFLTDIAHNADPSPQTNPSTGVTTTPVPDGDSTPSADFAHQTPGTYDDEMLDAHFVCGDGRCNENIALSTIHQVFHSEHDRLVDYIKDVLTADTSAGGVAALPDWQLPTASNPAGWNGERLFQAARFVTEMEYQHLVFEEFARKVQPAVRPFHVYSPDINPAIKAEFAHAVYRFGHSMLNDTVARTNTSATGVKSDNSVPLLTAFLNPPEYFNGGTAGTLTPEQAAGSVVMGSSDQVGNELDEFVTETLRNNLLGLPLDLPTLNMARAREAGVPPLNNLRRQLFAKTNDGQLTPYTDWTDFGQHLKHPESLINFVAAYGTYPTIRDSGPDGVLGNGDDVTTAAAKRAAARAIVDPRPADTTVTPNIPADVQPCDAAAFMFGTNGNDVNCPTGGNWSNVGGVTVTGLDQVDLWVGGLAEKTNLFGGLLGSTFNYVFQNQLENLQDGDRFYYLARTPGLNLRTQLEGNSFSELIQRNTDGTNSLKSDAFGTADCRFQLGNITFPAAAGSFITGAGSVNDDPSTTDCNENRLLLRKPDGTIQYRAINSVNPSGINGQAVYNGTAGVDRVIGGNDNDTFWGGAGNDVIEGNGGDDVALGGDGNDIVTDLDGADVLKGGPGNDAIDSGPGDDITLGGDGSDFLNGGANDNETFAGPGNDFIIAGQGADAVFGDGGDDWIQGGTGQDLLQGDHGAPFFDDPAQTAPGNDIMVGQIGENDYDTEGGDDIMAQNAAVDRNAGSGGFDWAIHQYNTVPANDDMMINNNLGGLNIQAIVNRDRWQETEADSGGQFNDVIKGTDGVLATPRLITGGGFQGCDALDQAGVARIKGLADLLPPVAAWPGTAAAVSALSVPGFCPLTGPVWGEGDILLGGDGSDTITGRAGDEIIDGDKSLEVHLTVRTNPADSATETGRTDLMENQATTGNFGTGTAGMTLQQAVFAGLVNPGNVVAVREIVSPATVPAADCGAATPLNCDTAVFLAPQGSYDITTTPDGKVVVNQTGVPIAPQKVSDGIDTLTNIEQLQFCNGLNAVTLDCISPDTVLVSSLGTTPPAAALSTTAVTLNSVGGASATQTVTLTNGGGAPLTFSFATTGTGFSTAPTSTCANPGTLNAAASCTIDVVFASATPATGALTITSNATGPASVVTLTGTTPAVPAPVAALTPTALTFSSTVGVASAIQTATLQNTGNAPLAITGIVAAGTGFTQTNTCGTSLAAAASCTISVRFTPAAAGASAGTVTISDNAAGAPPVITLSGTGTAVADAVPPTVTARVPAINATGFPVAQSLTATFSEAVTGVSTATFTVRAGAAAPVASVVSQAGNTFTLNPNANLTGGTQYTVTLTGGAAGIRDLAGNPLVTTSWTFITVDTIAPTTSALTPANNATNQAVTVNATATFSEAILGFSTVSATIRVGTLATGTLVPSAVTFNTTNRVLTINPTANLAPDTRYTVRLTGGAAAIRDTANNPLASVSWTFLTGPAPTVTARTPAAGTNAVAAASNVTATFSEAVLGFSTTTATVRAGTAAPVAAAVTFAAATRVLTINPTANLANDTLYTVTLTGGIAAIRDTAGNPLATTTWTFRTGPAPTVTARTPASGAVGVSRTANITATFSENVAGATVANVSLRTGTLATGALITSVVSYNATTHVVTINPNATLPANSQFTVRLTSGITDIAGNPLIAVTWSFTTGP